MVNLCGACVTLLMYQTLREVPTDTWAPRWKKVFISFLSNSAHHCTVVCDNPVSEEKSTVSINVMSDDFILDRKEVERL